jgi:protein-S-isoprenylcysteine O-methyltransferase Ste14
MFSLPPIENSLAIILAGASYGSFIWAATRFFRTGNSGANFGKRLFGVAGLIATIVCCWGVWTAPSVWSRPLAWLGIALNALALLIFWWAIFTVKAQPLDFAFSDASPRTFASTGPFAHWRHPFYTSYTYAWAAAALVSSQAWISGVALLMGVLYALAARKEEALFLESSHADAYRRYKAKTGWLLPRFSALTQRL